MHLQLFIYFSSFFSLSVTPSTITLGRNSLEKQMDATSVQDPPPKATQEVTVQIFFNAYSCF